MAFPLLVLVVASALVLLAISAPDIGRTIRVDAGLSETAHGRFVELRALLGLGLWIALWAVFLPTGALAWREPDALELKIGGPRLPEPIRDALLGLALAGGIVA